VVQIGNFEWALVGWADKDAEPVVEVGIEVLKSGYFPTMKS
jgi:hypothetical protein